MKTAAKVAEFREGAHRDLRDDDASSPMAQPPELAAAPEWASKAELVRMGFAVTRKRTGTRELAATYRVEYRGAVLYAGLRSEGEGWRFAAGTIDQVALPPGSCRSTDYHQRTEAIRQAALARRGDR